MKTAQSLNDMLVEKADAELNQKLNDFFKPIEDFAYPGMHTGRMDHAPQNSLLGGGYFNITRDVWPPHMLIEARKAIFEGVKRSYREKYIADFIGKVDSLQSQIESIQQEIQQ